MEKKFRQTVFLFKQFDPTKKFSRFDYSEMKWDEINVGYCQKNEIIKIDGNFYIFAGEISNDWVEKKPSVIRFKNRGKIVKEVVA